jgi:hypothetical protein
MADGAMTAPRRERYNTRVLDTKHSCGIITACRSHEADECLFTLALLDRPFRKLLMDPLAGCANAAEC